jgi:DDE family transposase
MRDELIAQDWDIVKRMLPSDWQASARQCGALRRCRNVASAETLLRLILLHVAGGLSLRQTVVRAEAFGWASLSDVALLKRLRASANWLEYLCSVLWGGMNWPAGLEVRGRGWRIVDATTIQEPAAVGISWRVHYSVRLPTLVCDFTSVTGVRGGETLCRIPVRAGEVILADRGYSHRAGVAWVLSQGGHVIVRHQGANFPLLSRAGHAFDLLRALRGLAGHQPGSWAVAFEEAGQRWPVWLHAVRKSTTAAERAKEELRRERGEGLQPETLELAEYVVVLTSLPPKELTGLQALGLYRGRWQIELVFKTLKGLLGIGDLAKYDPDSARAWMQAKLLTALLIERLEREARFFSPWGFPLLGAIGLAGVPGDARQPLAGDRPGAATAATSGGGAVDRAAAPGTTPAASTPDDTINGDN